MTLAYVEILTTDVEERSGRNERGFWSIRRQAGYLHQGAPYPQEFGIMLDDSDPPYRPGKYLLAAGSYGQIKGQWGLSRNVHLISFDDAVSAIRASSSVKPLSSAA